MRRLRNTELQFKKIRSDITGAVGIVFALMLPFSALAAGQSGSAGYGPAAEISAKKAEEAYFSDKDTLEAVREATQLIVVTGDEKDPAQGTLSWYRREKDRSLTLVWSAEAVSGQNGISLVKAEGDKKTPAGIFEFTLAFGLKENPGAILPYHQITEGDHYVDDSASRYYNRLVNEKEVPRDWNSSEVLTEQAPQYDYGLVINYNEACIPGKGSAIFLHCPKASNNTGTSGCISIPEDRLKEIICSVDAGTKLVIAPEPEVLEEMFSGEKR